MGMTIADISQESKLPLKVFHTIPLVGWCPEVSDEGFLYLNFIKATSFFFVLTGSNF